ncbi:MAG: response regulator [Chryseobacterium sp.]|nr:MAG: response regulator [Chryseobacterium sp.]
MKKFKNLNCVLLVDDDIPTNFIHRKIVQTSNVDVDVTAITSAEEALDFLTSAGKYAGTSMESKPGIIFLDINMPGMSGWDFMTEYEKIDPVQKAKTKVIMLTTSFNPDDKEQALGNSDIVNFMHKPLTREVFNEIAVKYFEELHLS